MGKDWNYARMTKEAAEAGGPDAWLNIIKTAAYNSGASDMKNTLIIPLVVTGFGGLGLGALGIIAYQKIKEWISDKKKAKLITENEAVQAEAFLKKELDTAMEKISADEAANAAENDL